MPRKSVRSAKAGSKPKAKSDELQRLREERRIDRLKLEVFKEIGQISHAKLDYHRMLERAMDLALRALNTDAGSLFIVDESTKDLVFEVVKGPQDTVKKLQGKRMPWGEGIVGHVIKSKKPYVSHNVARDAKWQKRFSEAASYKTHDILCVPLATSRGAILGAIQVINHKDAAKYTADDLDVLHSIADQIGMVMENAQLFFGLSARMSDLGHLHEISQLLTSSLDRVEVRRAALASVVELMNCETGSLYQVDKENQELYFDVILNDRDEAVKKIRLKMGEGIAGWVAKNRKPVLIPDCSKDKRFYKQADKVSKFTTHNMICAPLVFKDEVIGVLQAINRKPGAHKSSTFSHEDLLLLTDLANQVAIALKNAMLFEDLRRTFYESVTALAEAIELRDPYTGGHTQRVRKYSMAIGRHLGLNAADLERLSLSAILHDVGKIGVPDQILRKQGKLDYQEFLEMKKHPEYGFTMLQQVPSLSMTYDGVLHHHERFDGKGYPKGLKGEGIPLMARIIAVADTFDAMTTNRPYRDGLSMDFVLKEIRGCSGTQFDPKAVKAFLKAFEKGEIIS